MGLETRDHPPRSQLVTFARWRMCFDLPSKILAPTRYGSVDTELSDGDNDA